VGHDFDFIRLRTPPAAFPWPVPRTFGPDDFEPFGDPHKLLDRLVARPSFTAVGPDACSWETPDAGTLLFTLRTARGSSEQVRQLLTPQAYQALGDVGAFEASAGEWLRVATHADWRYVLEAYEYLRPLYPGLLILDSQAALVHDASSFADLIVARQPGA
jgi:hypothetical protein